MKLKAPTTLNELTWSKCHLEGDIGIKFVRSLNIAKYCNITRELNNGANY